MKSVDSKIETFQNNLNSMKKCLEEKDSIISILEKRLTDFEAKVDDNSKHQEKKIKELEMKVKSLEADTVHKIIDEKG